MTHDPDRTVVAGDRFDFPIGGFAGFTSWPARRCSWSRSRSLSRPAQRSLRLRHPDLDDLLVGHGPGRHQTTCFVPVVVAAAYPSMPIDKVVAAYLDKDMLLIIRMSMMTAAWARWGFARRIGLHFLARGQQRPGADRGLVLALRRGQLCRCQHARRRDLRARWRSRRSSTRLPELRAALQERGGLQRPDRGELGRGGWRHDHAARRRPGGSHPQLLREVLKHEVYFFDWMVRMLPLSLLVMTACRS